MPLRTSPVIDLVIVPRGGNIERQKWSQTTSDISKMQRRSLERLKLAFILSPSRLFVYYLWGSRDPQQQLMVILVFESAFLAPNTRAWDQRPEIHLTVLNIFGRFLV